MKNTTTVYLYITLLAASPGMRQEHNKSNILSAPSLAAVVMLKPVFKISYTTKQI